MKKIAKLIMVAFSICLVGLIFKIKLIIGGNTLLALSLGIASVLMLIQSVLIFLNVKDNLILRRLGVFMSISMSISLIAILSRYQWWALWTLGYVAIPLFIILTIAFFSYKKEIMSAAYKKIVWRNLIAPWLFIFVIGAVPLLLSNRMFYETFNYKRTNMTYEQFVEWCNWQNGQ